MLSAFVLAVEDLLEDLREVHLRLILLVKPLLGYFVAAVDDLFRLLEEPNISRLRYCAIFWTTSFRF